ncbi:MAG: VCBS repeat-containing protein [Chloroflexi bacterium]|nr:VCBS repeat-containing protein [Chloroflexota bacterium]
MITTDANFARSVYAVDVDGDGDIDVLSASFFDNKIAWYENTSGDGLSWSPHIITTNAEGAFSVYAADVDGDGDIDILSASATDDTIAWYENILQD